MAQQDLPQLQALITALFPTNSNQEITAERVRQFLTALTDSGLFRGTNTLDGMTLPLIGPDGQTFVNSMLSQMNDGTLRTLGSLRVGTNSIDLDLAHTISSNGENVDFRNQQSNTSYHPIWQNYELGRTNGVFRHRFEEQTLTINPDNSGTIINPDWTVVVPAVNGEQGQTTRWADVEVDSGSVLTNVSLDVYIEGVQFTTIGPFDITTGSYRFNYVPNFDFFVGANLRFVITSPDGDVILRANSAGTLPTVSTRVALWTEIPIGFRDDVVNAINNGTHTNITAVAELDSDGNPVINLTAENGGGTPTPAPSFTRFEFQSQPTSVAAGTTISGLKTFLIMVDRPDLLTGHLTITQDGDVLTENTLQTTVTSAGVPINNVTLSNGGDTTSFTITGNVASGGTITRHIVIRAAQPHELAYHGIRPTDDFSTVSLASLDSTDITVNDEFDVTGAFADQSYLGVLVPSNMDLRRITTLGTPVTSSFTRTENVRTIGTQTYISYILQNVGGIDGEAAYTVEVR